MRPSEQRKQADWIWQEYVRSGRLAYLDESVREDSSLLHPKSTDGSLLERAIGHGDVAAVQQLVSLGADVNALADNGYTYLHSAIEGNNERTSIVDILLKAGVNPSVAGICGWTALHHAAMNELADSISALVSHGANVNARTTVDNATTPLMEAACSGNSDSVRRLLELGADPSLQDEPGMGGGGGMTARDYAVEHKHPDVVALLDAWAKSRE